MTLDPKPYDPLKRAIDVAGALAGGVLLAPVLVGVAAAVAATMGRPVLFRQTRGGRGGAPFQVVKFRTMRHATRLDGSPLPDAERVTPLGHWLRATSVDELPDLWNVLVGRMSLVGPRPLLYEYVARYTPEQAERLAVRPGITGWAQVNGRNALSWEAKFDLDRWYVRHRSLGLDLRILALTVARVLRRSDVDHADGPGAPPFLGTARDD